MLFYPRQTIKMSYFTADHLESMISFGHLPDACYPFPSVLLSEVWFCNRTMTLHGGMVLWWIAMCQSHTQRKSCQCLYNLATSSATLIIKIQVGARRHNCELYNNGEFRDWRICLKQWRFAWRRQPVMKWMAMALKWTKCTWQYKSRADNTYWKVPLPFSKEEGGKKWNECQSSFSSRRRKSY